MSELLALQLDFAASLRRADDALKARRWIAGDAAQVDRRLAIYRANGVASADKALSGAYPVIRQAVGAEFFHDIARELLRAMPSTSGDLADFGAQFALFLADFEPTRSMPWLPDLARLEWAVHRAESAADAPAFDPSALAAVEPERQGSIRLHWSAGTAVIASTFPLVRIWTIHQAGFDGEFAVDWQVAERALVARDGYRVTVSTLTAGEAAFVAGSLAGRALADAAADALAADAGFDLGTLLSRAFASRTICAFTLTDD